MTHEAPPLTPMSLSTLLGRIGHEWETRKRIFDLPTARFWKPDDNIDLSFEFLGRRQRHRSVPLQDHIVRWPKTSCCRGSVGRAFLN